MPDPAITQVSQALSLPTFVIPRFECATVGQAHPVAVFGYENTGTSVVNVPLGAANRLSTGSTDGLPTAFLPGEHRFAFDVDLTTPIVTWWFNGLPVIATAFGPSCDAHLIALPAQDTGVGSDAPNANQGRALAAPVDSQHYELVQFARGALASQIGEDRLVKHAELVLTLAPFASCSGSVPWHAAPPAQPKLQALPMRQTWAEAGATWLCGNDSLPANATTDCGVGDLWTMDRSRPSALNPWYQPMGGPSNAVWHGGVVKFDVTEDVREFLGGARQRRDLGWSIAGTDANDPSVWLSTRESLLFAPRLEVDVVAPPSDPAMPRLSFTIDPSIAQGPSTYSSPAVPSPHPVVTIEDPDGVRSNMIGDELVVSTNDPTVLSRILHDWNATVLSQGPPPDPKFPHDLQTYVLQLDVTKVSTGAAIPELRMIDSRPRGAYKVSSPDALAVITAAATEYNNGVVAAGNSLASPATDGIDFESMKLKDVEDGPTAGISQPTNVLEWPQMKDSPNTFNYGVATAWLELFYTNRLTKDSVTVGVLDAGFALPFLDKDAPAYDSLSSSGDLESSDTVPWHGTICVESGFGLPGNHFGGAGPGGPVAHLQLTRIQFAYSDFGDSLKTARNGNPRILSISMGGSNPAALTFFARGNQATTEDMRRSGTLIFAAAGNDNADVDDEDCFLGCWESRWYWPCENDGVTCVGGMARDKDIKDPNSNYGAQDVDLYGPYTVFMGGPDAASDPLDFTDPRVTRQFGTSVATPFVAGVAALVMAADPSASADEVEDKLNSTARLSADSRVTGVVYARAAVSAELGFSDVLPPRVRILSPQNFSQVPLGPNAVTAEVASIDDSPVDVSWSTSDGASGLGLGTTLDFFKPGLVTVSATASNSQGSNTDSVLVDAFEPLPAPVIVEPSADGMTFSQGLPIAFSAEINPFLDDCSEVTWSGDIVAGQQTNGCGVTLFPSKLGTNVILATLTRDGLSGFAERSVNVVPAAGLDVAIVSPVLGADGDATMALEGPVQLTAHVVNPTGEAYTTTWTYSTLSNTFIAGTGDSLVWQPGTNYPPDDPPCGGTFGTLTVTVVGASSSASHHIFLKLTANPC